MEKYTVTSGGIRLLRASPHTFCNPFRLADLLLFDQATLQRVLEGCLEKMPIVQLAWGMQAAPHTLAVRLLASLREELHAVFLREWQRVVPRAERELAGQLLLDMLFWELIYWKTPLLYEELTLGEHLHPEIFRALEPLLRGKTVLDAGAGSGRATIEALQHGAHRVYAVEPSPGLFRLLQEKTRAYTANGTVCLYQGDFAHLPLPDQSVDLALACSAFTAEPEHGGDAGMAELKRVTRSGGWVVLIWPRREDQIWLQKHGFRIVTIPATEEMCIQFASAASARRCIRRFYRGNPDTLIYMLKQRNASAIPFAALGFEPPCSYCSLEID